TTLEKSPSDRKVTDANVTTYKSFTGNANKSALLLPYKKFRFNGLNGSVATFSNYDGTTDETASTSYRETLKYTHYDTQGNPLSLLINGGVNQSYLWSYKGQHPVAEIQNADNAAVLSALGGTSFTDMAAMTGTIAIQSKLDAVRIALPAAQVTSYLYTPLVGVSKTIDAAGKSLVYEYDASGRLAYIKDNAGKVRSSFCYNYAGQNIACGSTTPTGIVQPAAVSLLADGATCNYGVTATATDSLPTMGKSIVLTAVCAGTDCSGVTYTWTGLGVSGTGASKTLFAPGSTGNFQYIVTANKGGCAIKRDTITLAVKAGGTYVVANGCYTLNVYNSRLQNESDDLGARIRVYDPTTNNNQIFQLTGIDGDSYKILSASANKVWEPSTPILDWSGTYLQDWTGTTAQKWYLSPSSDVNEYYFASKANPSLVMELGGGMSTAGNYTVLWPLWGAAHQRYRLDPVTCPAIGPDCDFTVTVPGGSNNLSPTMGQQITLTPTCTGTGCIGVTYTWTGINVSGTGASKTFRVPGSTGSFQYTIIANKSGCTSKTVTFTLTVQAGGSYVVANGCYTFNVYGSRLQNESDALGARIRIYSPTTNSNQIFQLTGVDGDSYKILSISANKVWEPAAPIIDWSGTFLQNWTGTTAQKWYLSPTSVANTYSFASKANPSLVMELGGGVSTEGNYTVLWPLWGAAHQSYRLDPVGCPTARMAVEELFTPPAAQAQVLIYPNPVKDRLHLEINDSVSLKNLQLFNVKGTLVFETDSLSEDGIDVSALPDGTYLIKMVFTNGSAATYRIVKQ
ncbi:RICIN domain-containing protein, partial [Dyadobacter sp. LHD-138]|uniref:RICIN domain-containing protein n=1 Tax=Dyadobacter sp. LHD-138 TaxID=3071413 RepID=UPI0027E13C90